MSLYAIDISQAVDAVCSVLDEVARPVAGRAGHNGTNVLVRSPRVKEKAHKRQFRFDTAEGLTIDIELDMLAFIQAPDQTMMQLCDELPQAREAALRERQRQTSMLINHNSRLLN